jgi:lipopolysaccharide export system permease protein
MLVLAVPMGVLFSTLLAYGKLSAQNELTVIKSSGGSAFRAMRPAIIGGTILFIGLFLFNDRILPETNHKAYVMRTDISQFRPTAAIEPGTFSVLEGYSILARGIDRDNDVLTDVTIYSRQGPRFVVINARRAEVAYSRDLTKILMTLHNGELQRVDRNEPGEFRRIAFRTYQLVIETRGQKFEQTDPTTFGRTDRTMNIAQMQAVVDSAQAREGRAMSELDTVLPDAMARSASAPRAERAGPDRAVAARAAVATLSRDRSELQRLAEAIRRARKDANKYLVEIHKKYAIPAACLIFVFVGAPLGIIVRRGNFGVSAVIALGFFVIYWACLVLGEKLADRGIMHPAFAMWLGNLVVGTLGLFATTLVTRETVMPTFGRLRLNPFSRKSQHDPTEQDISDHE